MRFFLLGKVTFAKFYAENESKLQSSDAQMSNLM
jgi:hypothetical protein